MMSTFNYVLFWPFKTDTNKLKCRNQGLVSSGLTTAETVLHFNINNNNVPMGVAATECPSSNASPNDLSLFFPFLKLDF